MIHQIPPVGEQKHADQEKHGCNNEKQGYGGVPDDGRGREHQDTCARGCDPDETQVTDLSLVEKAGDHGQTCLAEFVSHLQQEEPVMRHLPHE